MTLQLWVIFCSAQSRRKLKGDAGRNTHVFKTHILLLSEARHTEKQGGEFLTTIPLSCDLLWTYPKREFSLLGSQHPRCHLCTSYFCEQTVKPQNTAVKPKEQRGEQSHHT